MQIWKKCNEKKYISCVHCDQEDFLTFILYYLNICKKIDNFEEVKKRIEASDIDYFDKPYRRFIGSKFEQETFFVEDPNGNVLEIKTMSNPEVLFEKAT